MKKGFTLVELLATITILGVIVVITYPTLKKQIKNTDNGDYDKFKSTVALAVDSYVAQNKNSFTTDSFCINLKDVVYSGYLKSTLKDPNEKTRVVNESVNIDKDMSTSGNSEYKYTINNNLCGNNNVDYSRYVKNGLILMYDGAVKPNINGTSLVWKDLSGNARDGILYNFDEGYQGANFIKFDGNNDAVAFKNNIENLFLDDFTIEIVIEFSPLSSLDTRDVILGNFGTSTSHTINFERGSSTSTTTNYQKARFFFDQALIDNLSTDNIYDLNIVQNIGYQLDKSANKFTYLKNGVKNQNIINTILSNNIYFTNAYLGKDARNGGTAFSGKIYNIRIYNRKLTSNELKQNHSIDQQRFYID